MGRSEEALARLRGRQATGAVHALMQSLGAFLEGDPEEARRAIHEYEGATRKDPETQIYLARHLAKMGDGEQALERIRDAMRAGFVCGAWLKQDPWLASLRNVQGYADLTSEAERRRREVHAAFIEAGGEAALGIK
jgi:hypothetical protein